MTGRAWYTSLSLRYLQDHVPIDVFRLMEILGFLASQSPSLKARGGRQAQSLTKESPLSCLTGAVEYNISPEDSQSLRV